MSFGRIIAYALVSASILAPPLVEHFRSRPAYDRKVEQLGQYLKDVPGFRFEDKDGDSHTDLSIEQAGKCYFLRGDRDGSEPEFLEAVQIDCSALLAKGSPVEEHRGLFEF